MFNVLKLLNNNFPKAKRPIWNLFYTTLALSKKNGQIQFMNYGYKMKTPLALKEEDQNNLFRIQLYHRLVEKINLDNKTLLEVGCGRGGGCSYYARYLNPTHVTGVDLSTLNIKICKQTHNKIKNLDFIVGDAENLPLQEDTVDVLINLESSHCYPNFPLFIQECHRVLKKDGHVCYADFILKEELPKIRAAILESGFKIIEEKDLTKNVLEAILEDNKINQFQETNKILNINLRKLTGAYGKSERGLIPMFKDKSLLHVHFLLKK